MHFPKLSLVLAAIVCLAASSLAAGDLPAWTDDSGIVLNASPRQFSPGALTSLTGRVYHEIDVPVRARWTIDVRTESGSSVRQFSVSGRYAPGEPIEVTATWDGRDAFGKIVPEGAYEVLLAVELRAEEGGRRVRKSIANDEEPAPRVALIEQRFQQRVIVASNAGSGRRITSSSLPPFEPGYPFTYYYGTLHNQTSYSDGGHPNDPTCSSSTIHAAGDFDPAMAYNYARNTGRLDFLGIVDHNHFFDNACPGCTAAQIVQRYHDGRNAAAAATVNGSFVGIYGMEWGYISNPNGGFYNQGHVNLYETPKLFGWEPTGCTSGCYWDVFTDPAAANYATMYSRAMANPSVWGAFGQFSHPSDGTKSAIDQGVDFNALQYTPDGDDLIHTIAVISGPASGYSTTGTDTGTLYAGEPVNGPAYAPYTSIDMYNRALGAGFHVAPVADPDVHCSNYGTSTRDRTVILATSLTKAALFDAIHNRRVYAASDSNVQLVYTMAANSTVYHMGAGGIRTLGPVSTSGAITLHTAVRDPDPNEFATSIKIKEPVPGNINGSDTVIATGTASPFDFTFTPPPGLHTYYVYVTLNTGDRIWSAPIWINQSSVVTPDFTLSSTPPSVTVLAGSSASYTININRTGGFTGAVSLSASGVPAGAAATFNPNPASTNSSALTVTTSTTTPAGSYPITTTGTSGSLTRTTSSTLVVQTPSAPDFTLSVSPASITVPATGGTATYTVTITPSGGFSSPVTLSASGLPAGATATFSPNPATGTSTLTVTVSSTTVAGSYLLTVSGTGGNPSLTRTATATLVKDAGTGCQGDC
jgi:hypothetical protein